ncbi:Scr1 family TA system antitoxin-like transcriptional regulator [Actinacidiphila oryziradicis]|uniref:DUF5753 domain-containing protein n=1 Tax=Actinacidiphila oryziradicis TaxID=2571141 RepID=A0A4U0SKT3_9ACTN|nr:Scr1 family TA system antitoxin-like transcriptional regulator [Actinacidiphila oryziradicis]TKA09783.1 hypothetical protein FCI23_20505 [Actinacidiphila oryziradicis]
MSLEPERAALDPLHHVVGHDPVQQLDTVQIDAAHGMTFLDAEPQLREYRALFSAMEGTALSEVKSRDFIRRITQQL